MVHEAMPASRLPVPESDVAPASAVTSPAGQSVPTADGSATTRPSGRVSVNDQPFLAARSFVFVIVSVRVETPPVATDAGLNSLSSCGVTSSTRMLS